MSQAVQAVSPMHFTRTMDDVVSQVGATLAFQEAILWEKRDRFCRASESTDGARKKDPSRYQMSAKAAKAQAGKYAVCQRLGSGEKLLPASSLYETIEEANDAWRRLGESKYVVACCNRLDRCWDTPKYNPMP